MRENSKLSNEVVYSIENILTGLGLRPKQEIANSESAVLALNILRIVHWMITWYEKLSQIVNYFDKDSFYFPNEHQIKIDLDKEITESVKPENRVIYAYDDKSLMQVPKPVDVNP